MKMALYRRARSVRAFRFEGDVRAASHFMSHLADCATCPSLFSPERGLAGDWLPEAELVPGRWHLFGADGKLVDRLEEREMRLRYEPMAGRSRFVERLGRVEGIGFRDGAFLREGRPAADPVGCFRGLVRLDDVGRPLAPADDPLVLQTVAVLRHHDADLHCAQIKLLCLLSSGGKPVPSAKADAVAALAMLEWPELVHAAADHDLAETSAVINARVALEEAVPGAGLAPPDGRRQKPH